MVILVDVCLPKMFMEQMGQRSAMDSPVSNHCFPSNELVSEVSLQMSAMCCYVLGKW